MCNLRSRAAGAGAFLALALTLNVTAAAEAQTEHQQILNKLAIQPPAWSQQLPASSRFVVVLQGAAVLDKETGLVWEKSPNTYEYISWGSALFGCWVSTVGGRKGWHLPTVEELSSLVAPTRTNPSLPLGHPFANVGNVHYWTSTRLTLNSDEYKMVVSFADGTGSLWTANNARFWCVRGGQSLPLPF